MKSILSILLILFSFLSAQKKVLTFGFEVNALVPVKFFQGEDVIEKDSLFTSVIGQKPGYKLGASVRYGFTDQIGLEVGIHYTKRNFEMKMNTDTLNETDRFGITGFEIPVKGLYFIKFNKQLLMNVGAGFSFDFFISNYNTFGEHYKQYTALTPRMNFGVLANLGFEYRLKKKGIIAIESSFHMPLQDIGVTQIRFGYTPQSPAFPYTTFSRLNGSYISIGLKYFFEEKPLHLQEKNK